MPVKNHCVHTNWTINTFGDHMKNYEAILHFVLTILQTLAVHVAYSLK